MAFQTAITTKSPRPDVVIDNDKGLPDRVLSRHQYTEKLLAMPMVAQAKKSKKPI